MRHGVIADNQVAVTFFAALFAEVVFIEAVAACAIGLHHQRVVFQARRVVVTGDVVLFDDLSHVRLLLQVVGFCHWDTYKRGTPQISNRI